MTQDRLELLVTVQCVVFKVRNAFFGTFHKFSAGLVYSCRKASFYNYQFSFGHLMNEALSILPRLYGIRYNSQVQVLPHYITSTPLPLHP